jgi:membrane-associated phospholipid phosphatase
MAATVAGAFRRNSILTEWIAFFAQVLIAVSVEVGDDLGRGLFSQHGSLQGITNARNIVAFEAAHGFWVEPAWQLFFEQTRQVLAITITWPEMVRLWNGIYVLGHIFVTLGVALWLYFFRRTAFGLARNILILSNILALLIYETIPVAPPRLTTNLIFDHHPFTFQDTVFGMVTTGGRLVAQPLKYNEFSALPSVHMAWALIVGGAILLMGRPLLVKPLGIIYPALMLIAIVVTGNHYIMDAVAAAFVVMSAVAIALAFERLKGSKAWQLGAKCQRPSNDAATPKGAA